MLHKCHGVSYDENSASLNSLFRLTSRNISKLHIAGPLWGESTSNWWIPLAKGQYHGKSFHENYIIMFLIWSHISYRMSHEIGTHSILCCGSDSKILLISFRVTVLYWANHGMLFVVIFSWCDADIHRDLWYVSKSMIANISSIYVTIILHHTKARDNGKALLNCACESLTLNRHEIMRVNCTRKLQNCI